ncbi:MAG: class I SAM-dependent methyltransferase [Prosthecobacter sp.]|uniref:class I SAM-dependent methyltransferase n=1 Tax=Prosthecobacter sp. TaxID=1965333 RepID=UPI003900188E
MKLHYGCGLVPAQDWYNCDASPTLRLQRLPIIGPAFQKWLSPCFPQDIHYGDIVRGLRIAHSSCEAIYCSHILEHLSLEDCRTALRHSHAYLKPGGTFRLVVPDFARQVEAYQSNPNPEALSNFLGYTHLGRKTRPKGLQAFARELLGNSHHLWMWDEKGLAAELRQCGFSNIRRCQYGDAIDLAFREVENPGRFVDSLAFDCGK